MKVWIFKWFCRDSQTRNDAKKLGACNKNNKTYNKRFGEGKWEEVNGR